MCSMADLPADALCSNQRCEQRHLGIFIELDLEGRKNHPANPKENNALLLFKPISFLSYLLHSNN